MQELVYFLIEERYCNSELEAIKILESVSDEFYDYLIEAQISATDLTNASNKRLRSELSRPNPNKKLIIHLVKKIKGLKGPAAAEAQQRPRTGIGLQPTPRGPGGSRAQKPRDVISTVGTIPGVQKTNQGQYSKAATRLTGISSGSGSRSSVRSPETGEMVAGLFDRTGVSGGRGTGTTRTGGTTPRAR